MTGFTGTSTHLQSITTAHNQWLLTIHSTSYWTTSVFSSTLTNEESLPIEISWTELTSKRTEYKSPCLTVSLVFCSSVFIRCQVNVLSDLLLSNGDPTVECVASIMCLQKHCLAMVYSGFQALWHTRHRNAF
jgi:hypothetical protein